MKQKTLKLIRKTFPRIRVITVKGVKFYQVDARRKGTNGKQESFTVKAEAECRAQQIASDYAREGADGLRISSQLRVDALRASAILTPYGKGLVEAATFYAAHLDSLLRVENSRFVKDLAQEWFENKKRGTRKQLREVTLRTIANGRDFLVDHFGAKRILQLRPEDIGAVLDGLQVGLRRKFNLRSLMSQFFNWCISKRHCAENPCSSVEIIPENKSIMIATPAEVQSFLSICEDRFQGLILYHAILFFAGLRPFECQRLNWGDVHLKEGFIFVGKATSKVKEDRRVPIERNLAEWLKKYGKKQDGLVVSQRNFGNQIKKFRAAMGYKANGENPDGKPYPQDLARHSYASYWLPKNKDRAHLAEYMGNSLEVIRQHYRQVVSETDADAFWGILPAGVAEERDAQARLEAETLSDCGEAVRGEDGNWMPVRKGGDSGFDPEWSDLR